MNHTESGFITNDNGIEMSKSHLGFYNRICISKSANSIITKTQRNNRFWILKSVPNDTDNYLLRQDCLRKEYDILCQLNHPAVVQAIELADDEILGLSIVMEYIDGQTLHEYIRQNTTGTYNIIIMILDAMIYIHGKQIVHRDLKPENILITHNGQNVKIIDFGFADSDSHSNLKEPAGTFKYISPEQMNVSVADIRNDIYSLGVIFEELNTGWQYRHIIRRMKAPINLRYNSVNDVKTAFRRASRVPYIIICSLLTLSVVCFGAACIANMRSQQKKIADQELRIATQEKVIDEQVASIKKQTFEMDRQKKEISRFISIKAEQDRFDALFAQGKKELDNYMVKTDFKHYSMTVELPNVDIKRISETSAGAYEIIFGYVEKQALESQKTSELRTLLEQYFMQEYWQPWTNRCLKNGKTEH